MFEQLSKAGSVEIESEDEEDAGAAVEEVQASSPPSSIELFAPADMGVYKAREEGDSTLLVQRPGQARTRRLITLLVVVGVLVLLGIVLLARALSG